MSGRDVNNIAVEPCIAYWGEDLDDNSDLGFLDGDIEVTTSEDAVDITTHQTGTAILDAIRTGKTAKIKLSLKEAAVERLKKILQVGGDAATPQAEIFTVLAVISTGLQSKYFLFNAADDATKYYLWFNINSAGVDPAIAGRTAVPVALATGATAAQVATAMAAAIDALATMTATVGTDGLTVTATTVTDMPTTDPVDGNSGLVIAVTQHGADATQIGWGVSKDFHNMAKDSKKLILRPIAADVSDATRNLNFWKAYPTVNSIKISGENPRMVEVEFRIFQDPSRPKEIQLFAVGDSR